MAVTVILIPAFYPMDAITVAVTIINITICSSSNVSS